MGYGIGIVASHSGCSWDVQGLLQADSGYQICTHDEVVTRLTTWASAFFSSLSYSLRQNVIFFTVVPENHVDDIRI